MESPGQAGGKFLVGKAKEACGAVCVNHGKLHKMHWEQYPNMEKGQKTSRGSPSVNKLPTPTSTYHVSIWEGFKKSNPHLHTPLLFKIRIQKVFPLLSWGMYWGPRFPSYITYLYPKALRPVQLLGYISKNNVTEKQHNSVISTQASLWGCHSAEGPGSRQHKNQFFNRFCSRRMTQRPTNAWSKAENLVVTPWSNPKSH